MTVPANRDCPLCGTPMVVGMWMSYGWANFEVVGITCPRKYCGQNMVERQIYERRANDPWRPSVIETYRRFCGL